MIKVLGCQQQILALVCLAGEDGLSCETIAVGDDFEGGPVTLIDWETGQAYSVIAPNRIQYDLDQMTLLPWSDPLEAVPLSHQTQI